jgi:microcystin-dependent protein
VAYTRETTVNAGPQQDNVKTGILKLDQDLTNAYVGLNDLLEQISGKINVSEKGLANGLCPLNSSSKVDSGYLPSIPSNLLPTTVMLMVPIGGMILWATDTAPANYLPCEGGEYSTTEYAALYAVIGTRYGAGDGTFKVPDFRGLFVRGWSHASNVDPDAGSRTDRGDGTTGDNIGTKQGTQNLAHTHTTQIAHSQMQSGGSYVLSPTGSGPFPYTSNESGGSESRPKNISMLYIIRYQ